MFKNSIINNLQKKGKKTKNEKFYKQFSLSLKNLELNPNNFLEKLFDTISPKITLTRINKKKEQIKLLTLKKQTRLVYSNLIKDQNILKNPSKLSNLQSDFIKNLIINKKKVYKNGSKIG